MQGKSSLNIKETREKVIVACWANETKKEFKIDNYFLFYMNIKKEVKL